MVHESEQAKPGTGLMEHSIVYRPDVKAFPTHSMPKFLGRQSEMRPIRDVMGPV